MMAPTTVYKLCKSPTKLLAQICILLTATLSANNNVQAGQGNMYFGGDVTNAAACIIFVTQGGNFTPNTNATQLSSKLPGGVAGKAEIWSFRKYDISVSSPTFFDTYPTGGDTGVNFTTTFSGRSLRRGRTFPEQSGDIPVRTKNRFSRTEITVHLVADKLNGFPAGNYSAHTVVRCE